MARLGFVAAGMFFIFAAMSQMRAGRFVFDNASYHQQTFAAGGIGVGIIFILLALLPTRDWVYKHITTKNRFGRRKNKVK